MVAGNGDYVRGRIVVALRDIEIKPAYYSDEDNLLEAFYLPVLSNSVRYDRIAGYFSSNSLAIAAKGIAEFINNGGKIRLVANVVLSVEDQEAIKEALLQKEQEILTEIENLEDRLKKDHISMLGWMVRNKLLEIKIAVVKNGIEHQKIGILEDVDGNTLSFSGSDNETVQGWLHNDELFHVFCSWKEGDEDHLRPDIERFGKLWQDEGVRVKVYDVSDAFNKGLIRNAPSNGAEFETLAIGITDELLRENSLRYAGGKTSRKIGLRDYQKNAVKKWVDHGCTGILEMATGTGKTFTALACLAKIKESETKLAVVITAPYQHLIQQWKREIAKFGISSDRQIIADSTNIRYKDELADGLSDITLEYASVIIVLTTHDTFSSYAFGEIITQNKKGFKILLIADEVHAIGAEKRKAGLLQDYDFKLALSATPKRWFDDAGTQAIYDYFGEVVFEFSLRDAINTMNPDTSQSYLTPYCYIPQFVSLSEEELREYTSITQAIMFKLSRTQQDSERDELVDLLLFRRANTTKNADAKYQVLENILDDLGAKLEWTIIYCTPQQIDRVMEIIKRRRIIAHRFTMAESTRSETKYGGLSQRDFILQEFAEGKYRVLVAMKCLDWGVDVPPARKAILMASSGNPGEYIQRIGRVIRRYPGKKEAAIYDIVVKPSFENVSPELRDIEFTIFEKELRRYEEVAKTATNNAETLRLIYDIKETLVGTER
ncbi:MAG: DEAD/DEAH box helicase family protein [Planctomycetota bacterium]|jgi:superfamily II DNA or RNA helicase